MPRRQPKPSVFFDPPPADWPAVGVYQLWIRLARAATLEVGRLGNCAFPAGDYVYTGRASRALPARVARYFRLTGGIAIADTLASAGTRRAGEPRCHWHIDYLLSVRAARIAAVRVASDDPEAECAVHQAMARWGDCVAPGFGASDCRHRCPAHLWLMRADRRTAGWGSPGAS